MTVFGDLVSLMAEATGFKFKSYTFTDTPYPPLLFSVNTLFVLFIFLCVLYYRKDFNNISLNILFFMIVMRFLALDFIHVARLSTAFHLFFTVIIVQLILGTLTIERLSRFNWAT